MIMGWDGSIYRQAMDAGDRGSGGRSVFTTVFAEIHQGFGSGEPHTQLIGRFWGVANSFW